MYKKVVILPTQLLAPITKSESVLLVPNEVTDLLGLTSDDWTYLRLSQGQQVEIIKVVYVAEGRLHVVRGIEGTIPNAFAAGAKLDYVLTTQEIVESIEIGKLELNSLGIIRIDRGKLEIPKIQLRGLGGLGDGLPIHNKIEAECCGQASDPPEIPLNYWPLRRTGAGQYRVTSEGDYRITR